MVSMTRISVVFISICAMATQFSANAENWACPNAEQGRELFLSGEMASWPNYSESHGARVQRQHPKTAFIGAQAKFIDWNGKSAAICQYYSHIGLVATSVVAGANRRSEVPLCKTDTCSGDLYWRYEFTESSPELDKKGEEQVMVCMADRNGQAFPSTACGFEMIENAP